MSHHRQMAVENLDKAGKHLQFAQTHLIRFVEHAQLCEVSEEERNDKKSKISSVHIGLTYSSSMIIDVLAIINQPNTAVLDVIRRKVNSPRADHGNKSILFWFAYMSFYIRALFGTEPTEELANLVHQLSLAWEEVDFALWHVNDAIREEIYQDAAFAESLPEPDVPGQPPES